MSHSTIRRHKAHNVRGWERTASIVGGLLFLGRGLSRGSLLGLVQMAVGGLVLNRGLTGHCKVKQTLEALHKKRDHLLDKVDHRGNTLPIASTGQTNEYSTPNSLARQAKRPHNIDEPIDPEQTSPTPSTASSHSPEHDVNPSKTNGLSRYPH